jgi:hypothetical protein
LVFPTACREFSLAAASLAVRAASAALALTSYSASTCGPGRQAGRQAGRQDLVEEV